VANTLIAGTITSGSMSANRGLTSNVSYNIALSGANLNGNPFSLAFNGLAGGVGYMGEERCLGAGAPFPINCTWDFVNPGATLNTSQDIFTNIGQIVWDGTTYDFTGSSPYTATLTFSVNASPVTVASTVGLGLHNWEFPVAPAAVAIDLTILQGTNTLVSETLSGAFRYSGSAFQAPVGSDWTTRISHQAVPEPASLFTCAAGLLAAAVLRRRS
jgi:hypothetical protein